MPPPMCSYPCLACGKTWREAPGRSEAVQHTWPIFCSLISLSTSGTSLSYPMSLCEHHQGFTKLRTCLHVWQWPLWCLCAPLLCVWAGGKQRGGVSGVGRTGLTPVLLWWEVVFVGSRCFKVRNKKYPGRATSYLSQNLWGIIQQQ